MTENNVHDFDILVAGAGFGGSLMALVLNNMGFRVCLVEKGKHPRFAIGESSTPVADLILRELSKEYNLPWLKDFSRYGSWQQAHPEIVCGIKRGFSYFKQYPDKEFTTDANHSNELLVAASTDDMQSDTNWLRADFDAFVAGKAEEAGIAYFDLTEIVSVQRESKWKFHVTGEQSFDITASFFIDATGGGILLDKLLGVKSSADDFLTNSFAVFSHFNDVPRWTKFLQDKGIPVKGFPYDPDNSALHQVIDEGWMWMLRFNDARTSLGFALNGHKNDFKDFPAGQVWDSLLDKYPTLHQLLSGLELSQQPGAILRSARLQRKTERGCGPGWVALPHTVGFVDPLFSSGIAHSLAGIKKIAAILKEYWGNKDELQNSLTQYEHSVFEELKLTDQLVAGCYQTMHCFGLFNAWSMLYFTATIAYEQRLIKKLPPGYFLSADDQNIKDLINLCYRELNKILQKPAITADDITQFTELVREKIAPYNIARLLDPELKNMYRHTGVSME